MIPPGFIQELLSRTDVVDVVSRHVELKRSGANFMGLCPFHAEKSPSFSVNPAKQFYYCFGCGAGGDAIRFLTEHLGLSFAEAVRDLAQSAGLAVPEEQVSAEERQRRDTLRQRRLSMGELLARAAGFYRGQLREHARAVEYLKRRGLTGRIAQRFELGYAPPGWRTLASVFGQYDDPLLEEAGLVRQREADRASGEETEARADDEPAAPSGGHERGRYDWFRDRIMFPIRGVDGQVIGFGGRVLDDSKPKYINSPETPLFSKGRELYGLFEARQALREKGFALVVEGYMDVVALAQSGFANAVATLGTACTAEHVAKLFRFTDRIVFSFDGDAAGRRAAARALEAALPHAGDLRNVSFLFLPPEHDPDSYVRALGPEAFERALADAVPLSRQLIEQAAEDATLTTPEGRARMLARAKPMWQALPEGALKRQLLAELARQGQLDGPELARLWGEPPGGNVPGGAARAPAFARPRGGAGAGPGMPGRSGLRRAPAAPADVALRLLLRHSDWWERLPHDEQALLHGLGGKHAEALVWLEAQIHEHGPLTWASIAESAAAEPWFVSARSWVDAAAADEEQSFEDLGQVLRLLWLERLGREADTLARRAEAEPAVLRELQALNARIRTLKTGS